jgi:ribosomal protein L7Ae-like RNA K-turn-binding protein
MAHGARSVPAIPPNVVVGARAAVRAATEGNVAALVIATDAPAAETDPVRQVAAERSLVLIEADSALALGARCGLRRPVAALAELRTA